MSVSAMDGGLQITKTWQNTTEYDTGGSSPMLLNSHSIPGLNRALTAPFPPAHDHRLPPISTTCDTRLPSRRDNTSPIYSDTARSYRPQSPLQSPTDRPDKRPRWHYNQTPATSKPFRQETDAYLPTPDASAQLPPPLSWDRREGVEPYRVEEYGSCSDTQELVKSIVSGLLGLEAEIRHAFALETEPQNWEVDSGYEIIKRGLRQSLLWASNSITASSRIVRDVAVFQRSLPPPLPADVATTDRPIQIEKSKAPSAPIDHSSKPLDQHDRGRQEDVGRRPVATTPTERSYRVGDTLSSILPVDQMKKGYAFEQGLQRRAQSRHRSSSGSIFGSGHSPMLSQHSSRTLPSPSGFQFPPSSSGPENYSPSHAQSAQTAHLQDLQHQISMKTLALQTLQREHDQLLAAFSRSQMRCSTLDKKSQVSEHEINSLTDEKIRLQQQVEAFEGQVEELVKARDEAQKRSSADGDQWRQIMNMSSLLQAKSIEESRRYKADRKAWEHDRAGLQQRIQELEAGKLTTIPSGESGTSTTSISPDDILASASLDVLREEIVRLRRSCMEMELLLRQIKGETDEIDIAMSTISSVRERIRNKMRRGLHEDE